MIKTIHVRLKALIGRIRQSFRHEPKQGTYVSAPVAHPKEDHHSRPLHKDQVTSSTPLAAGKKRKRKPKRKEAVVVQGELPRRHHPEPPPPAIPKLQEIEVVEGSTRFSDLGIATEVLLGIQNLKFKYSTPVQAESIPAILAGRDLAGKAQTGTGKTAAFLTSIFTHFLANPITHQKAGACRALILAPTRELAMQIYTDAEAIGKYCGCHNVVVFGGMDHKKQESQLDRPIDLLIGTPGRIIDFIRGLKLHFEKTEILVIDEADRMLDMGFIPDVKRIVSRLPQTGRRQTLFFSATLTGEVEYLMKSWLHEPVVVETEPEQLVTDLIDQKFIMASGTEKLSLLLWYLKHDQVDRAVVFVNRKHFAENLMQKLQRRNISCEALSGDVPQKKRLKILDDFKAGHLKLIVATDVAARGIHVNKVTHVFNYDIPVRAEEYVHRIGRTGRAGTKGKAISFVCEYGAYMMPELEKILGHAIQCESPSDEALAVLN